MKNHFKILAISLLISLVNCNNFDKRKVIISKEKGVNVNKNIENFDDFFIRFSKDINFRISRIKFPLAGYNSDERKKSFFWTKEEWLFYSEEDFKINKDATKRVKLIENSKIIYRIYKENSGYDIKYTFVLINDKWNLVFYSYKNI